VLRVIAAGEMPCNARRSTQLQRGFTLIELVSVLVILGSIAVMAAAKITELRGDAHDRTHAATAFALKAGIDNARLAWRIAPNGNQALDGSEGLAYAFGNGQARFTANGWLMGTSAGATLDSAKCREIWNVAVVTPPLPSTYVPGAPYHGELHGGGFCYYVRLRPNGTTLMNSGAYNSVYIGYDPTGSYSGIPGYMWVAPYAGAWTVLF
jgi:prepilin-type N-terminal cleavage/methylation domain-containing protein